MKFKENFSPIDIALHLNPGVPHGVLPRSGRDHPADVSGNPTAGQIPAIHYDPRLTQRLGYRYNC